MNDDIGRITPATRVVCVLMPNRQDVSEDWKAYRCTVVEIEQKTGQPIAHLLVTTVHWPDLPNRLRNGSTEPPKLRTVNSGHAVGPERKGDKSVRPTPVSRAMRRPCVGPPVARSSTAVRSSPARLPGRTASMAVSHSRTGQPTA